MLDITSRVETVNPAPRTNPTPERVVVPLVRAITAQNIAKQRRSAAERRRLAAALVRGRLVITRPTGALAARVFNISQAGVSRELAERDLKPITPADLLAFWWESATPEQRDVFVRKHGVAIWRCIDRLTR